MFLKIAILIFTRSAIECGALCLRDSKCSGFIWNSTTSTCQIMDAMGLAGDESDQGVAAHIDKSLAPGLDL
jgi:hypothetical protein